MQSLQVNQFAYCAHRTLLPLFQIWFMKLRSMRWEFIPAVQPVMQTAASKGFEMLKKTKDELEENYKVSEKGKVLRDKTRATVNVSGQTAEHISSAIKSNDFISSDLLRGSLSYLTRLPSVSRLWVMARQIILILGSINKPLMMVTHSIAAACISTFFCIIIVNYVCLYCMNFVCKKGLEYRECF